MAFAKTAGSLIVAVYLSLGTAPSCLAVEASSDGMGQVVIIPVFSTAKGLTTLLTVANPERTHVKAVTVRILGKDGELLDAMNVYLRGYDSWVAAIGSAGDGISTLSLPDNSCTLRSVDGVVSEAESSLQLDSAVGFIEVYETGDVGQNQSSSASRKIQIQDCAGLVNHWQTGPWATDPTADLYVPRGTIRAAASLINVEKGTLYSIDGRALIGFTDRVTHALPTSSAPNLASGHDGGTDTVGTSARVCTASGCSVDSFASPLDAVSAALMVHELVGEFVVTPELAATTDIVVTYPTRALYPEDSPFRTAKAQALLLDRSGVQFTPSCTLPGGLPDPPDFCGEMRFGSNESTSLAVLSLSDRAENFGQIIESAIVGIPHTAILSVLDEDFPKQGYISVGFETNHRDRLTSVDGSMYVGRAALGLSLIEVTNGTLDGDDGIAQRANYGGASVLSMFRRIEEPN